MATLETKKLGGPYTKSEQEERRKQVHMLYFEKGFSAVKIANELGVNRNTINEDIRYWLSHIGSQMPNGSVTSVIFKQIEILENQRQRLLEQIEDAPESNFKIKIEKMIFEITYKIASLVAKMPVQNSIIDDYGLSQEISDEEISEIINKVLQSKSGCNLRDISLADLKIEAMKVFKNDNCRFQSVLNAMKRVGLELFVTKLDFGETYYDFVSFAAHNSARGDRK